MSAISCRQQAFHYELCVLVLFVIPCVQLALLYATRSFIDFGFQFNILALLYLSALLAPWNFRQRAEAPSVIKQRCIFHWGAFSL